MSLELYFLKSAACLAILMIFYKLLLEKENMHVFKRGYLLMAVLISFVVPWITFTTYAEPVPVESVVVSQSDFGTATDNPPEEISYLPYLLWSLYGIGVLFFGIKFILNLRIILLRIKRNPKIGSGQTINVLLQERLAPHTFWNYIFLNKRKYEQKQIPKEVFQHEQAHADQRHTADILFMELLQIIFWFHPLLYMVKKAIKLNHEFLADCAVLKKGIQTADYQKTLLAFSSNAFDSSLVNPINYQSIKKRFTVMRTNTSKRMIWAKSLVLLPLLAVLVYSFSTKETVIKTNSSQELQQKSKYTILPSGDTLIISEDINIRIVSTEHLLLNGNTISYDELPELLEQFNSHLSPEERNSLVSAEIFTKGEFPAGKVNDVRRALYHYGISRPKVTLEETPEERNSLLPDKNAGQEKATPEMIEEYNRLVKRMNEEKMLKGKEGNRILYIESLMTPEQKKDVVQRELKIVRFPPDQEKVTPEMVKEYNKLAKLLREYNEKSNYGKTHPKDVPPIRIKDIERMKYIYSIMSEDQKKKVEPLPGNYPPPPPPAEDTDYTTPPQQMSIYDLAADGAIFYYKGKIIEVEIARELVEVQKTVYINLPIRSDGEKPIVKLTDKNETTGQPTSPPQQISIYDLAADGATFYYKGRVIEVEKARQLVEIEKTAYIELPIRSDEKPIVKITDKKKR